MAKNLGLTKWLGQKQGAKAAERAGLDMQLIGAEALRARLKDPEFVRGPVRDFLFHAASIGKREAMSAIDGGTGIAVRSINAQVYPLHAMVSTAIAAKRARSIEQGRRPGELIPFMAAARWVTGRQRRFTPTPDERRQAYAVMAAIQATGAKGKHFISKARAKVKENLPRLVSEIAEKIKRKWGGVAA